MNTSATLAPEEAVRLTEIARACKAAARAVMLYPGGHPAIVAGLNRLAQLTSPEALPIPLRMTVLADALKVDGRPVQRPDPSIGEFAALLHAHGVAELTIHAGGAVDAWRAFFLLLARTPESVRADGGIASVWTATGLPIVELREIDYSEVLRERPGGLPAVWDDVIASCLEGRPVSLNDDIIRAFLDVVGDSARMTEMLAALEQQAAGAGMPLARRTAALITLLNTIVDAVSENSAEQVDALIDTMASAVGTLSPDMMLGLLAGRQQADSKHPDLVETIAGRMSDKTVAQFVARNASDESQPIDRLAQAFQALVRDTEQQERMLVLAHDELAATPFGSRVGFEETWNGIAGQLLTSYSDKPYVSDEYGYELSTARERAITVEQVDDDPPDRVNAWLATVATSELRRLDLALMLDLVRLEDDAGRRAGLVAPLVALFEDLLLVGDFDAAHELMRAVGADAKADAAPSRKAAADRVIGDLVAGPVLQHLKAHLTTLDEGQFDHARAFCVALGDRFVSPLAEALASEERSRARERLTAILMAFGPAGRREAERLRSSPNPAVRRTAVYLLREFGGSEALDELTALVGDSDPHVQREAVRAILNIGDERAFGVLERAIAQGDERSRAAIMQSLAAVRDERAAPLFAYVIRHVDHRGALLTTYLRAIDHLGDLKNPLGVAALRDALYRGDWWAPRRTAQLRGAAAAALARVGTSDAATVLDEAIRSGPRGVRAAVRSVWPAERRAS